MTLPLNASDLYHTGIVVPDLEAEMARLGEMAGYRWTTPMSNDVTVRIGADVRRVEMSFVYSLQAPHIELIQAVPGTPWLSAPGNAVHHLGYFTDTFTETADALQRNGFQIEVTADSPSSQPALFAYFVDPAGVRIEIVDRTVVGDWATFLRLLTN
ncbi:VOC family protein [Mycobacterium hodleri]|uniref:VOC family protein n=1 Tax=Mycolicibacterium hodleri TaxID=49897 RepID=A0A544W8L2_9MYCO|nr:VOC family protein [Mycolicibacterium hodleri]TQR88588.1 VOC family protein [Mycolicibacterium hodleri]